MRRKKYEPKLSELKKAWLIKQKGGKELDIRKKLKIGPGQYERARQSFNAYFRQEKLVQKNKDLKSRPGKAVKKSHRKKIKGPNCKAGEQKLSVEDIDLDILRSYVICGFNKDKIAGLLGVSRTKFWELAKSSQAITDILQKSMEETAADVLGKGLLMLCKEHTVKDTHFASYQGDIFSRDYDKKFRPHLGAIKYLLSNTIGWQSENKPKAPNNKGAILRMMDDVANHEDGVGPVDNDQSED